MLVGFFAETFRLIIPIFSLENTYTLFLRSICKISFFGQMHVLLSILLQGAFANNHTTKETDKLLGIISISSLCLSLLIPINFSNIKDFYIPVFGFHSIFEIIRGVVIFVTLGAMLLSPLNNKSRASKITAIGFIIIITGYILLLKATMLAIFIAALIFFLIGTYLYLKYLYLDYMWK